MAVLFGKNSTFSLVKVRPNSAEGGMAIFGQADGLAFYRVNILRSIWVGGRGMAPSFFLLNLQLTSAAQMSIGLRWTMCNA